MKLTLKRIAKKPAYTIGRLYIDNVYFCDTIEDKDRGLTQKTPLAEIKKIKVPSETAIPTGTYGITIDVVSPKFSKRDFYMKNANKGRLPRLLKVPGFDGVLMHCGVNQNSSAGCIIVGKNTVVGRVTDSPATFIKLYTVLTEAKQKGETIEITVA